MIHTLPRSGGVPMPGMRFATIDVGTNSALLLVAEVDARGELRVVCDESRVTGLGRGMDRDGRLAAASIARVADALREFADLCRTHGAAPEHIVAVGTEGLRRAPNGDDALAAIAHATGITVQLIDGATEAAWSRLAVACTLDLPGPKRVVDIGGGSTEIIDIESDGATRFAHSFPIGSVRLLEESLPGDPPAATSVAAARARLHGLFATLPAIAPGTTIVGVGGTVTTLAATLARMATYDARRIHGMLLPEEALHRVTAELLAATEATRALRPGVTPGRASVLPAGALILTTVVEASGAIAIVASQSGLRHGAMISTTGTQRFSQLFPNPAA